MNEEKSLFDFNTLPEVKKNFSLKELVKLARGDQFSEWIAVNFYTGEAQELLEAVENEAGDAELKMLLIKIFQFDFEDLSEEELDEISAYVSKMQRKKLSVRYENLDKKTAYVENQSELVRALWDGAEVLYLYGAAFKIPLEIPNKTYVGYGNAIIDVTHKDDVDLDAQNVILENLQLYLHYPINLKMEKSKNVQILNGTKKTLSDRPTLQEIFDIMRGCGKFESPQHFQRRAEDIRGVAVGEVLLKDKNYSYEAESFKLKPQWDFEYVAILRNYAKERNFFLKISPQNAEILYGSERKLQIFADFAYIDGKLTILNLYVETLKFGRLAIESILRELENKISSGSGVGGLGYGLDIISEFNLEG